jgi:hypothetical protein
MEINLRRFMIFFIALLSGAVIIYLNFYKISYKEMIPAETDMIIYLEKDKNFSKELEGLLDYFEKEENRKIGEDYISLRNNINRIVILGLASYGIDYRPISQQDLVAVFDFGKKFPVAKFKLSKYFSREGNVYKLKEVYKNELISKNILKENENFYLSSYRGYQILSFNKKAIEKYKIELGKNKKNDKFIKNIDGRSMYMIDFDKFLKEPLIIGGNTLDNITGSFGVESGSINIYNTLNFKEDKLSHSYSPENNKILDKYVKKDKGLYINNESLADTVFFITVYLSSIYDIGIDNFKGLDWSTLLEKIGTEVYIDIEGKSGVVTLKDPNFFIFMFELLLPRGEKGEYIVNDDFVFYLQDNLLFINEILPENFDSKIDSEDIIKLNLPMKYLSSFHGNACECGGKLSLIVKNSDNKVKMNIVLKDILNDKFKEKLVNKIENNVLEEVE